MGNRTNEDRRQASGLTTTLSGYVMTATLAVLGAQAVLVTFVVTNKTDLLWFYVVSAGGIASLLISFIAGGRGIYELIRNGYDGNWRIHTRHSKFEVQAMLSLLGTVLVVASAFLGQPG